MDAGLSRYAGAAMRPEHQGLPGGARLVLAPFPPSQPAAMASRPSMARVSWLDHDRARDWRWRPLGTCTPTNDGGLTDGGVTGGLDGGGGKLWRGWCWSGRGQGRPGGLRDLNPQWRRRINDVDKERLFRLRGCHFQRMLRHYRAAVLGMWVSLAFVMGADGGKGRGRGLTARGGLSHSGSGGKAKSQPLNGYCGNSTSRPFRGSGRVHRHVVAAAEIDVRRRKLTSNRHVAQG